MRADSLNDKISHRPSPEKLIKEGVLHEDPRTAEEKYEEAIEEEYAKREGGAWIDPWLKKGYLVGVGQQGGMILWLWLGTNNKAWYEWTVFFFLFFSYACKH